jgi:bacterioferritin B
MISNRLAGLLVSQIESELTAHQTYHAIATYFQRQSLNRWGKLFHDQAVEEATHARRIIDFLIDQDVEFDLPALGRGLTGYGSALEAVTVTLENERRVSSQFAAMAKAAVEESDHTSLNFLQWFIDEQVEEERTAQLLVDLVASSINLFQAEALLDSITAAE